MDATMLWPTPRNFVRSLRCSFDVLMWGQKQTLRLLAPFMAPFMGNGHARMDADERLASLGEGAVVVLGPDDISELDEEIVEAIDEVIAIEEIAEMSEIADVPVAGEARRLADTTMPFVAEAIEPTGPTEAVGSEPGRLDDLTVIDGIGPKLAERLNTAGVSTFAALAAWQPADIERFEATLPRVQRGRLEREDWIGQASVLSSAAG